MAVTWVVPLTAPTVAGVSVPSAEISETVASAVKFAPVIVTAVVEEVFPSAGETAEISGGGSAVIVNAAARSPWSPFGLITRTSYLPTATPAGTTAVTVFESRNATRASSVGGVVISSTRGVETKSTPEMVTLVVEPVQPNCGVIPVSSSVFGSVAVYASASVALVPIGLVTVRA